MLPFAAAASGSQSFTFMGAHGTLAIILMLSMGSMTLVAVFKTGLVPMARAVARIVEAGEVILGTEKTDGLVKRLDQADIDRTSQIQAIEDIHGIIKKAGLLNGKGELLVQNVNHLMATQNEWREVFAEHAQRQERLTELMQQHVFEESTRNAALWSAIIEQKMATPLVMRTSDT